MFEAICNESSFRQRIGKRDRRPSRLCGFAAAEKNAGKVKNAVDGVKDATRDALKK
jgi:hypothetical protein